MYLDRPLADIQLGRDFLIALAGGHPSNHVQLSLGEIVLIHSRGQVGRRLRGNPRVSLGHGTNATQQFLAGRVFQ